MEAGAGPRSQEGPQVRGRAGQGRAGQGRAGQGRAALGSPGQPWAALGRQKGTRKGLHVRLRAR